jgi:hypothetical protein
MQAESAALPPSPFAKFQGSLDLGIASVDCYVLDTGERVISYRATVKAIADVEGGQLLEYIDRVAIRQYITKESILSDSTDFFLQGTQLKAKGIKAEAFLDICKAYVSALASGGLTTERQKEIAIRCSLLLSSCSYIGIIALIDEATGYQYEREDNALQIKIKAYIAEELRDWEKTFPDELWEEFGRLTNWKGPLHSRPKWWGKLVVELIYDALDPEVSQYLKDNKPSPKKGQNYHQWLTADVGLKHLIPHINQVIGIAKSCKSMKELQGKVRHIYMGEPLQLDGLNP